MLTPQFVAHSKNKQQTGRVQRVKIDDKTRIRKNEYYQPADSACGCVELSINRFQTHPPTPGPTPHLFLTPST